MDPPPTLSAVSPHLSRAPRAPAALTSAALLAQALGTGRLWEASCRHAQAQHWAPLQGGPLTCLAGSVPACCPPPETLPVSTCACSCPAHQPSAPGGQGPRPAHAAQGVDAGVGWGASFVWPGFKFRRAPWEEVSRAPGDIHPVAVPLLAGGLQAPHHSRHGGQPLHEGRSSVQSTPWAPPRVGGTLTGCAPEVKRHVASRTAAGSPQSSPPAQRPAPRPASGLALTPPNSGVPSQPLPSSPGPSSCCSLSRCWVSPSGLGKTGRPRGTLKNCDQAVEPPAAQQLDEKQDLGGQRPWSGHRGICGPSSEENGHLPSLGLAAGSDSRQLIKKQLMAALRSAAAQGRREYWPMDHCPGRAACRPAGRGVPPAGQCRPH